MKNSLWVEYICFSGRKKNCSHYELMPKIERCKCCANYGVKPIPEECYACENLYPRCRFNVKDACFSREAIEEKLLSELKEIREGRR